jgi:hypothetical protein
VELTGGRRIAFATALVLAIAPWVYQITFVNTATGTTLQITQFVAAWLGVIAFCTVGPLAFASRAGIATYALAAAGPVLYQTVQAKSSALFLFTPSPVAIAAIAILWYALVFSTMRVAEPRGRYALTIAGLTLALLPLIAIVFKFVS